MSLEVGFILAAGKGTRMGELGMTLPKPLWPVFDCSLLEMNLRQLRAIGAQKIFANTHHQAHLFEKFVKENELDVDLLHEPELLGSGGAFHNLRRKTQEPRVLAINSDCLYLFSSEVLEELKKAWCSSQNLLLGQKVEPDGEYNKLMIQQGKLLGIQAPPQTQPYWTFSGVSLIHLDSLEDVLGASSFFDTVAEAGETSVLEKEFPIYDYGTLTQYEASIWKTFEDQLLRKKLEELRVLNPKKLNKSKKNYRSETENVLNFTACDLEGVEPGIYLESQGQVFHLKDGEVSLLKPQSI